MTRCFVVLLVALTGCTPKRSEPACPPVDNHDSHAPARPLSSKTSFGRGPGVSLAVADLDDDGQLDVVAARGVPHEDGGLEIHYGPINGTTTPTLIEAEAGYGGLAVGDLDGDGCLDLALAIERGAGLVAGGVDVLLGRRNGPRCELDREPAQTLAFARKQYGVDVALGDFDHDGRLDLAATQTANHWRRPKPQLLCFNDSQQRTLELACKELDLELGGAFAVEFADIDADGYTDLLFGGVDARLPAGSYADAWAVIVRGRGSRTPAQTLAVRRGCTGECKAEEFPNLMDLEVIPRPGRSPLIGAVFSKHVCAAREACERRSVAAVFELESIAADTVEVTARESWTSASVRRGNWATIEAVAIELDATASPALVLGFHDGTRHLEPGGLFMVRGRAQGWEPLADNTLVVGAGDYYSYALVGADIDASHTRARELERPHVRGDGRLITLDRPLHWRPKVYCDGEPVKFGYAIESSYLTLAQPCAGNLGVNVREGRAQDLLFVPSVEASAHPIHILEYRHTD